MSSSDRRPYLSAAALDQATLDFSQDNLTQRLEMIADIDTPIGFIRLSDRAKYVDGVFYSPRVVFPLVRRTVGDWLSGELEFSDLVLSINNTDKEFSALLPGGASFAGFIGREVTVSIGLAEIGSTYSIIFKGRITDVGGFSRNTSTFTITCRSDFEQANVSIPNQVLIPDDFPDIEDDFVGLGAPIIYGDWTTNLRAVAPEIPCFPVNGANATVLLGNADLRCVISSSPIKTLDTSSVTLFRGDEFFTFAPGDIAIVAFTDQTVIDITQKNLVVDASPWIYEPGDQFFLKVVGVDLTPYDENIVWQARDILIRFGGLLAGDFDGTWATLRDKAIAPSNIATITSRVWIQETINAVEQVTSMLEQVRVQPFVNRLNLFSLTTLHFEDFKIAASTTFAVKDWDVNRGSMVPTADERNNFNRAKADFSFSPPTGENKFSTALYRNDAAITQAGREISKLLTFPNLPVEADVVQQLIEIIRLASAYAEMIEVTLTSRAVLQDIGNFLTLDFNIGAIEFGTADVVGLVREIGYNPEGLAIPLKIWSLQMINYPGYTGPAGTVGGFNATVIKET